MCFNELEISALIIRILSSRSEFTASPQDSFCHRFQTEAPIEAKAEVSQAGTSILLITKGIECSAEAGYKLLIRV